MSDNDAWDADDYEPPAPGKAAVVTSTDKWEGEDEDDDVKDAWDADSDDESKEDKAADGAAAAAAKAPANKKKAKLRSKIALREAAENQADEDLTPEEKAAEKLRAMKMEENAQMKLTRDMLGVEGGEGGLDSMVPVTKEEFTEFAKALCEKIRLFNNSEHYNGLLESITKDLVIDMSVPTLKKVKIHVEGMHSTRLKEEKSKTKKPVGKGKTSLKNDLDKDLFGGGRGGGMDDYGDDMDDFM